MAKSAMRVKDTDLGMQALLQHLGRLTADKPTVVVGIVGAQAERQHKGSAAATVVEIGAAHEFGAGVPRRSFLRSTVDEHRAKYVGYLLKGMRNELSQVVRSRASGAQNVTLKRLGLMVEGDIKKLIADGIEPPNSPLTIARKKSDKPLIDTGQLRASIASEIRKGSTP